jgi:hypothetical protein
MPEGTGYRDRLNELHQQFGAIGAEALNSIRSISIWSKIFLILAPSVLSAVLVAIQAYNDDKFNYVQIGAIIASCAAFLAGLVGLYLDHPQLKTNSLASNAITLAGELHEENANTNRLNADGAESVRRHLATNDVLRLMSSVLEQGLHHRKTLDELVPGLVRAIKLRVTAALGFSSHEAWAVQVYTPQKNTKTHKLQMVCIGQLRAIDCELSETRKFDIGIGIPGQVLATKAEKVVGDVQAPQNKNVCELPEYLRKKDDETSIRSIACVPILYGQNPKIWGAICGTSAIPDHFSNDGHGLARVEVLRMLVSVLAIATVANKSLIKLAGSKPRRQNR